MANKQTLPGTVGTQKSFVNTQGAPKVPEINFRSAWKDAAGAVGQTNQFLVDFSKLKYDEFQAGLQNLEFQQLHEMQDAMDPCQLEEINQKYAEAYINQYKNDPWGKSYYSSRYFQTWNDQHLLNQQKVYLQKQHEFTGIQMERTLNEMSSAAALSPSVYGIDALFANGMNMVGNSKHLTPDEKNKLQMWYAKNVVEKVLANNPNMAVSLGNAVGSKYDKYGIDFNEIRKKADAYNLAMRREQRAEERYQEEKIEKVRKSVISAAQAQIIQDPSKADAIIAGLPDNESFVAVSEWYRKGLGKDTTKTKSPLSQDLVEYITENGMDSVRDWMRDNPEYINDTDARTAVNQALSQTKEENTDTGKEVKAALSKLTTKEKFEKYMSNSENATRAITYANETVKNLNKRYGIEEKDYVSSYIADLNARKEALSANDIRAERVKVKNNTLLSDADKNKVYKVLDSFETKAEKGIEKGRKELSSQALNSVRLVENQGSDAIAQTITDNIQDMDAADLGKALELRNAALRREGKESKEALKAADKKMQENLYTTLLKEINEKGYNDTDAISTMQDKGLLTSNQAGKLLKSIYDKQDKATVQAEKDLIKNAYLRIYEAEANNELPPTILELNTDNPQVIKERGRIANKVAKNRYISEKNIITEEIFKNPPMTREDVDDYVARLSSLNYIGNDKSPEQEVQEIISKAQNIPEGNRKYIADTLYSYMPKPLNGKQYSNYELNLRNQALDEVLQTLADKKTPDITAIANKYKPTKDGLRNATMDADNAYYNLLTQNNSLFSKVEYTTTKDNAKIKQSGFRLNPQYKFADFANYIATLNAKRDMLTDAQYKELYKPVALYMGDIIRRANSDKSIEAYAMNKLLLTKYSNKVDNPEGIYEDYLKVMNIVEKNADRTENPAWWFGMTKDDIDIAIQELFKNSPQLQGNGGRI